MTFSEDQLPFQLQNLPCYSSERQSSNSNRIGVKFTHESECPLREFLITVMITGKTISTSSTTLIITRQHSVDVMLQPAVTLTFDLLTRKPNQCVSRPRYTRNLILGKLAPIVTKILYSPGFFGSLPAVKLTFAPKSNQQTYECKYTRDQNWVNLPLSVSEIWCSQGFPDIHAHRWMDITVNRQPLAMKVFGDGGTKTLSSVDQTKRKYHHTSRNPQSAV